MFSEEDFVSVKLFIAVQVCDESISVAAIVTVQDIMSISGTSKQVDPSDREPDIEERSDKVSTIQDFIKSPKIRNSRQDSIEGFNSQKSKG